MAERPRQRPPKPERRVRLPPGTLPLLGFWACRLTGRRSACTRQMRFQLPSRSTVRCWPGGGMADTRSSEGRAHRGVRVQVPPWSPTQMVVALVVKRDIMAPSEGAGPGSTPGRGTVCCFDGERDITRPCEGRVPGSTPGWSTVAELKAAARPGCEPGMCGFDSRRPPCPVSQALGRGPGL